MNIKFASASICDFQCDWSLSTQLTLHFSKLLNLKCKENFTKHPGNVHLSSQRFSVWASIYVILLYCAGTEEQRKKSKLRVWQRPWIVGIAGKTCLTGSGLVAFKWKHCRNTHAETRMAPRGLILWALPAWNWDQNVSVGLLWKFFLQLSEL